MKLVIIIAIAVLAIIQRIKSRRAAQRFVPPPATVFVEAEAYSPPICTPLPAAEYREWEAREAAELREAEQKRELALADIERWECLKQTYIRLLEAIEDELADNPKPQRTTTLLSKLGATEKKIHDLDRKCEIAYAAANKY